MRGPGESFPALCRQWRQRRHLSQLALAEQAGLSQRHLSWLETGRSQPSREMVLRLADSMDIPLRERNTLLTAAGFAARYRELTLDDPAMAPITAALRQVLQHHEPFPAIAVDRSWNLVQGNNASALLFALAGADTRTSGDQPFNLARATLDPEGLRQYIRNADTALPAFIQRLRSDARASGESAVVAQVEALIRSAGELPLPGFESQTLLPVMPLELAINDIELSLFTVISTFGTPQDITTDELRVEAFYPADDSTRAFFTERANQ